MYILVFPYTIRLLQAFIRDVTAAVPVLHPVLTGRLTLGPRTPSGPTIIYIKYIIGSYMSGHFVINLKKRV